MSKNPNNQPQSNPTKSQKGHRRNNSNSYNQNVSSSNMTLNEQMTSSSNIITQVNQTMNSNNILTNIGKFQTSLYDNNQFQNTMNSGNLQSNPSSSTNLYEVKTENNTTLSTNNTSSIFQKVDCVGKVPTPRFGHTITQISPVKVVLFGGAIGDTSVYQFTNDTYVLNLMTKIWVKLESNLKS